MIKIMVHELEHIAELETEINKKIVDLKMRIVNYLDDNIKSLNRIAVNRTNGYLKIETRTVLPDEIVNGLESEFKVLLDYHGKVAVETNELYNYIFKPSMREV